MEITKEDIHNLILNLRHYYHVDFSNYAEGSFKRRVEYILTTYGLASVNLLIMKLKDDKEFSEKLINDITVNTTELFRDPDIWLGIKRNLIPRLRNKQHIDIWHCACSSGEEVYSMQILLNESGLIDKTKTLASDLNTEILKKAQTGTYNFRMQNSYFTNYDKVVKINPLNEEEELDIPYTKYFDFHKDKNIFTIKPHFKHRINFKQHNLSDKVHMKFDIIFCRNVIIYFNSELQNHVIKHLYDSLHDDGCIVFGAHESIAYLPISHKFNQKFIRGCYVKK